ncbi:hypothetical protein [Herbiconiux daphne]|uniref:DUF222 domain-containing protein n=1 Tax=Herbiconiux daphne TaxID=2970914 RepID=A0ABT2H6H2_9MICO|nr:hypothetical protein [Herbiconiux daphne]MCS5735519.1 hypothetical protein [Herbiconiux daphne]
MTDNGDWITYFRPYGVKLPSTISNPAVRVALDSLKEATEGLSQAQERKFQADNALPHAFTLDTIEFHKLIADAPAAEAAQLNMPTTARDAAAAEVENAQQMIYAMDSMVAKAWRRLRVALIDEGPGIAKGLRKNIAKTRDAMAGHTYALEQAIHGLESDLGLLELVERLPGTSQDDPENGLPETRPVPEAEAIKAASRQVAHALRIAGQRLEPDAPAPLPDQIVEPFGTDD